MHDTEKVIAWIDRNTECSISFLQDIIRIPSVTGNEGPIQCFLEKFITGIGALRQIVFIPDLDALRKHRGFVETTQSYAGRPNVVGVLKGTGGGRSLLFNGHVDVIPEGAPENWKHGWLVGRYREFQTIRSRSRRYEIWCRRNVNGSSGDTCMRYRPKR